MAYGIEAAEMIDLDRVFLDTDNPRHKPFKGQPETIAFLCREEQVITLAEDIAKHGLNPLELFALVSDDGGNSYYSAEGNRRLCALQLLNDPDRAPANLRKRFASAAKTWTPIEKIFAVVFQDLNEVRLWRDRIHGGPDHGRGRRSWDAEQKSRNTSYSRNNLSQAILDLAQKRGYITEAERKGRMSTIQKYLANPRLRESIGLATIDPDDMKIDLSEDEFSKIFRAFIRDVAEKKIDTRTGRRAEDIRNYARKLEASIGMSGRRTQPRSLTVSGVKGPRGRGTSPSQPKGRTKVPHDADIEAAIKAIPSYKLEHLYFSLTSISMGPHTPLLYVAAWSLIECLTRAHGSTSDFQSYLSRQMLNTLGFPKGNAQKSIRQALQRIADYGNSTKHDHTAAAFNGEQLANDIEVLGPLLKKLPEGVK